MKAKNSKFISIVLNALAICHCWFSGSHLDQVLPNIIYVGTTKKTKYLPQRQAGLSCSLHLRV